MLARCVPVITPSFMYRRGSEVLEDPRLPFDVVSFLTDILLPDPWLVFRSGLVGDLASGVQAYVFGCSVASEMCVCLYITIYSIKGFRRYEAVGSVRECS